MKASMQVAASTVPSNEALPAMPKRKTPWQQSSPAISEDQLDFEIFAADPVRLTIQPHQLLQFTLPIYSSQRKHIPRERAGRVRR